jgi:hypothetical protein
MTDAQVCVPNIGPRQRRQRLLVGLAALVVTGAAAAVLISGDSPRLWRLGLLLPAFMAALGVMQARAQTCVALAARGVRNMDTGDERVLDAQADAHIRRQSRQVLVRAALAAVLLTAVLSAL